MVKFNLIFISIQLSGIYGTGKVKTIGTGRVKKVGMLLYLSKDFNSEIEVF